MDVLKEWWGLILSAVATVVWLVRLESRGKTNATEIKRLWSQRKEDLENAQKSRDEQAAMLTEIRGDVKKLLARRD